MTKNLIATFIFLSVTLTIFGQNNTAVIAYIEKYKALAMSEMIRTGIPASITLAQGILESNAGLSDLVQASNNHFGIKCKSDWFGKVVYHDDDAKGECFRSYRCAEDSYKDHSDFLKTRPNYAFLFNIDPADYEDWALGLKKAGYATNPVYAQSLVRTINDYALQQYTLLALQNRKINGNLAVLNEMDGEDMNPEKQTENISVETEQQSAATAKISAQYSKGVFTINNTKVIYMPAGVSLFALASNYHISYNKLLDFNDLTKTDILSESRLVYLEKKPKRGEKNYHIVNTNETLEIIAQKEGVQLESLLAYNKVNKSDKLNAGSKIYLRPADSNNKVAFVK